MTRRFPGFTGHLEVNHAETLVRAIEPDGAGGWFVGGEFLRVDGRFRTSLVHVRADGSVDPRFRADVEGTVHRRHLRRDRRHGPGRRAPRACGLRPPHRRPVAVVP